MRAPTILYILAFALLLSSCASNGISVTERSPDGTMLEVKQSTVSTMFAKTQEGVGNFLYTAESPDGSKFDMRAGATVVGQDGGDPSALVLGVLQAIMPVISQKIEQPRQEGVINPEDAEAAIAIIEAWNRQQANR